ncbi:indolepyruvate ferredoxin oxidoreductase family protein [Zooshikella sp. RANM57]|uniref:indolepyruvate ferredoxin oxidoreductase family protein n=1 Tax=Zooshikella sp. RANM57 TaxID=3425863 RepID=UPI003D6E9B80
MNLADVSLDDKYTRASGKIHVNGAQAVTRLLMLQQQHDQVRGLHTAGFVSGYRGSPLGGLDKAFWQAKEHLKAQHIRFQPGINEDLGATAVWGSQQVGLFPGAQYQGVFGLWYGKGPGVDRTGDVFKHANAAGSSHFGGVLALAGDDHACKSSTLPHQSDYAFADAMIPVLYPGNLQELIDYGLFGYGLSRFSGCWVGVKALADIMDSTMAVAIESQPIDLSPPPDFILPENGLNIRWPDPPAQQEARLHDFKLPAVHAFVYHHQLDQVKLKPTHTPTLGIVTSGKSYYDTLQALELLGVTPKEAAAAGIGIYKAGLVWPLEPTRITEFAKQYPTLWVVEEKRPLLEDQLRQLLYHLPDTQRPQIYGKASHLSTHAGLTSKLELSAGLIAQALGDALCQCLPLHSTLKRRLEYLKQSPSTVPPSTAAQRAPHYCSGCPHNTSTKVPEGSRATGGIGCHYMVTWMNRNTDTFTQMGGEGVTWIGQAPFTETSHIFQNLGDGTYYHSGILAIRAAVAANVNITYKILYNDAVAMTGGQPVDGPLSVGQITQQVAAEGVTKTVVVTDTPEAYQNPKDFAPGVEVFNRDALDHVQKVLRETEGTTVLIYAQTCAAEKRRRRKRKAFPDPAKRLVIHPEVCEGCGDCGQQSGCLSIQPKMTPLGRKRAIEQSSCNKDYSCNQGFCPSFVTVKGGQLRQGQQISTNWSTPLPEPTPFPLAQPYNILVTGIGGTGVVTIGALLGMAAHLEGKGFSVLDQTGLAQKYGGVTSHIRIAPQQSQINSVRTPSKSTDLLLACDLMVAAQPDVLEKLNTNTAGIINNYLTMPAAFTRDADFSLPATDMLNTVQQALAPDQQWAMDAHTVASTLLGDAIACNLFIVGVAYQHGLLPVSAEAINKAIALNNVAVTLNQQAFLWGRRYAYQPEEVMKLLSNQVDSQEEVMPIQMISDLDTIIAEQRKRLTAYQSQRYADRFEQLVRRVQQREQALSSGDQLSRQIALNYAHLLAYKDEYEVARLFSQPSFQQLIEEQFTGSYSLEFNFAPPFLSRCDPYTGLPRKRAYGGWLKSAFKLLQHGKRLRGTPFDPFSWTKDRRFERQLIHQFEHSVSLIITHLTTQNYAVALKWAALIPQIRGYGHIKVANYQRIAKPLTSLLESFTAPATLDIGQQPVMPAKTTANKENAINYYEVRT